MQIEVAAKPAASADVTVVFAAEGRWYQGDPSGGAVRPIALEELAEGYAGDVAVVEGDDRKA